MVSERESTFPKFLDIDEIIFQLGEMKLFEILEMQYIGYVTAAHPSEGGKFALEILSKALILGTPAALGLPAYRLNSAIQRA